MYSVPRVHMYGHLLHACMQALVCGVHVCLTKVYACFDIVYHGFSDVVDFSSSASTAVPDCDLSTQTTISHHIESEVSVYLKEDRFHLTSWLLLNCLTRYSIWGGTLLSSILLSLSLVSLSLRSVLATSGCRRGMSNALTLVKFSYWSMILRGRCDICCVSVESFEFLV